MCNKRYIHIPIRIFLTLREQAFLNRQKHFKIGKFTFKTQSQKYALFDRSITCVKCGIKGKFFIVERSEEGERLNTRFHANLYAVEKNGKYLLMTKDHIVPVSKGGKDSMKNYQVMCSKCNTEKADKFPKGIK
jgi:5-methylcytosine-specific restriction endonuclease McrA